MKRHRKAPNGSGSVYEVEGRWRVQITVGPHKRITRTAATKDEAEKLRRRLGTDLIVVKDLLGHSSLAMTADLYSHVVKSMQNEAADRMTAFLEAR